MQDHPEDVSRSSILIRPSPVGRAVDIMQNLGTFQLRNCRLSPHLNSALQKINSVVFAPMPLSRVPSAPSYSRRARPPLNSKPPPPPTGMSATSRPSRARPERGEMILVFSAADYAVSVRGPPLPLYIPLPPAASHRHSTDRARTTTAPGLPTGTLLAEGGGHNWRRLREWPAQPWQPGRVFDALCRRRGRTPATSCGGTCAYDIGVPATTPHRQTFPRPPSSSESPRRRREARKMQDVSGRRRAEDRLRYLTPHKTKVHNEFVSWCAYKSQLIRTATAYHPAPSYSSRFCYLGLNIAVRKKGLFLPRPPPSSASHALALARSQRRKCCQVALVGLVWKRERTRENEKRQATEGGTDRRRGRGRGGK